MLIATNYLPIFNSSTRLLQLIINNSFVHKAFRIHIACSKELTHPRNMIQTVCPNTSITGCFSMIPTCDLQVTRDNFTISKYRILKVRSVKYFIHLSMNYLIKKQIASLVESETTWIEDLVLYQESRNDFKKSIQFKKVKKVQVHVAKSKEYMVYK